MAARRSTSPLRRHARLLSSCLLLLLLTVLPSLTSAYTVYVPAKSELCFHEHVFKGDKVVGSYQVSEGGNLDIDMRVLGPDSKVVYEKERTTDGSFQFKSMQEGNHNLCFDNRMSTVSGKLLTFALYVGDALHKKDAADAKALTPLEQAVVKTSEGMQSIRDTIQYLKLREERHAKTVDSTNSRVIFWNSINVACVLLMAALQVVLLRGMFEKTRKVSAEADARATRNSRLRRIVPNGISVFHFPCCTFPRLEGVSGRGERQAP
jgi:hypothetical protein